MPRWQLLKAVYYTSQQMPRGTGVLGGAKVYPWPSDQLCETGGERPNKTELHVDEVLFRYEVIEQFLGIAKQWAEIDRNRPKAAVAQSKLLP